MVAPHTPPDPIEEPPWMQEAMQQASPPEEPPWMQASMNAVPEEPDWMHQAMDQAQDEIPPDDYHYDAGWDMPSDPATTISEQPNLDEPDRPSMHQSVPPEIQGAEGFSTPPEEPEWLYETMEQAQHDTPPDDYHYYDPDAPAWEVPPATSSPELTMDEVLEFIEFDSLDDLVQAGYGDDYTPEELLEEFTGMTAEEWREAYGYVPNHEQRDQPSSEELIEQYSGKTVEELREEWREQYAYDPDEPPDEMSQQLFEETTEQLDQAEPEAEFENEAAAINAAGVDPESFRGIPPALVDEETGAMTWIGVYYQEPDNPMSKGIASLVTLQPDETAAGGFRAMFSPIEEGWGQRIWNRAGEILDEAEQSQDREAFIQGLLDETRQQQRNWSSEQIQDVAPDLVEDFAELAEIDMEI